MQRESDEFSRLAGSEENIARASRICLQAGADFLKTSTGKEAVNATFPAGRVMLREIERFRKERGRAAGFKASGGIRTPEEALEGWLDGRKIGGRA